MAKRLALLIGNTTFNDKNIADLKTPEKDVSDFASVLENYGEFKTRTLINETSSNIHQEIEDFYQRLTREDVTLLFYTGQGIVGDQGEFYIVAKDTQRERIASSAVSGEFIQVMMRKSRSLRQIAVMDTAFGGRFIDGLQAMSGSVAAIAASSRVGYAYEESQGIHSILTKYLLQGITTGEADLNSDGLISVYELFNYIRDTIKEERPEQEPQILLAGGGDIVIAKTSTTSKAIEGTLDLEGKLEPVFIPAQRERAEADNAEVSTEELITRRFDITTHALSDAPTTHDLLGFSVYVEALAKFIEDQNTKKPITIAIDAPWGMGKSSLMRMLEQRLARPGQDEAENGDTKAKKKLPSSPTVWFNAWQYDQSEAIWANLVLEILEQVGQRLGFFKRLWMKWRLDSKRFDLRSLLQNIIQYLLVYVLGITLLGLIITIIALLFLDSTLDGVWQQTQKYISYIGWGAFATSIFAVGQEVYKKLSQPLNLKLEDYLNRPDYEEKAGFLPQLQADFRRVVEVVTQNGRWPLIIFIDDLDRCEPPKPVDIVEAINLLLDSKHCVFIIGMDTRTVAGSIEAKYKNMLEYLDHSGSSQLGFGQQFLEKIVQIRFRIPRTNPAEFEKFIQKHLVVSAEPSSAEVEQARFRQKVTQAAALMKAEQREAPKPVPAPAAAAAVQQKASATFTPEVLAEAQQQVQADEDLFDKNPDVQQTIIAAAEYFNYNPRQVKRFINFYRLQAFIAQQRHLLDQKDFDLGLLGKWLILSTGWPDAVTAMRGDDKFISRFFKAAEYKRLVADHQIGGEFQLAGEDEYQQIKSRLDGYLQDKTIARLVDNRHLNKLLGDIHSTKNIQLYLDLVAISAEATEETLTQVEG